MSPTTPDNGGDSTPAATPILITCPYCQRPIPPIVGAVPKYAALERKLSSATYPFPITNDRRMADTEIIDLRDEGAGGVVPGCPCPEPEKP